MKVNNRIITNNKCDIKNEKGTIIDMSKDGRFLLVQLDMGMKLLTMNYAVNPLQTDILQ